MSFFANPFSSKRRREVEDVELGSSIDVLAPDTPPSSAVHLQGACLPQAKPTDQAVSPENSEDGTLKVRARAEYFESLIRTRTALPNNPTSGPSSENAAPSSSKASSEDHRHPVLGGLSAAAAADALENLRLELTRVEEERQIAVEALRRKTQEVENLKNVVRQLSESRAAALTSRASLAEQFVDLRRDHDRVARVADLSRIVSKENLELTKAARTIAAKAEREASAARREAAAAGKAENYAAMENAILREKVSYLERLDLEEHSVSVCKREFTAARVIETY